MAAELGDHSGIGVACPYTALTSGDQLTVS